MRLHGTIDRQELVKYLASMYAFSMTSCKDYLRKGNQDQATLHAASATMLRLIIWIIKDGVI